MLPANRVQFFTKVSRLVLLAAVAGFSTSTAQVSSLSFTKYSLRDSISSITAGPDGALWFTQYYTDGIGRITTDGTISGRSSPVTCCPSQIVAGPDGALWVTGSLTNQIGRVTTIGVTTTYGIPTQYGSPAGITSGPDGALWFAEAGGHKVGRITTAGALTEFPLPGSGVSPFGITAGPDGAMWYTQCCDQKVGRITTQGQITEYALPTTNAGGSIVAGPDGALWFTEDGKIGRITTGGIVTEYSLPIPGTYPVALALGPDGAFWFPIGSADYEVDTIGRITTAGVFSFYSAPYDFVTAVAGPDGAMWFAGGIADAPDGYIVRAVPGSGLTVATLFLPGGTIPTPYSASLLAAGGKPPYLWSVSAGTLPVGLVLNPAAGAISGAPGGPGANFTMRVTDSSDPPQSATRPFRIAVSNSSSFSIVMPSVALFMTVDGVGVGADAGVTHNFPCIVGTQHTVIIDTSGLLSGPTFRYSFDGWSDGVSSPSRQITCLEGNLTYSTIIDLLLRLTTSVLGAGTISANPASSSGFYLSGTTVQLTASGNFTGWSGDLSGTANPQSIVMNGAKSVTASFGSPPPPTALLFTPTPPCRMLDTRKANGPAGGPFLAANGTRSVAVAAVCSLYAGAAAYSLNVTAIPRGSSLGYLTVWPFGQTQPLVSTLNSPDGSVLANAAIVYTGGNGIINLFATDDTDLVIDINGYFTPPPYGAYQFYPLRPCRLLDTRNPAGTFGGPSIPGGGSRSFPISFLGTCGVPSTAAAYSLNITAVPHGSLGFLTAWAAGEPQPLVSTLNSVDGTVIANAAIVQAGSGGAVSFYASDTTDLVVDINGYFAHPGSAGLNYYAVAPCRLVDTRNATGPLGGPGLTANSTRTFPLSAAACGLPSTAAAYALNITVQPSGFLGYLTAWPTGQPQPLVSTLNASKGLVVANAALLSAGAGGSVDVFATNPTQVIIDTNGYFGP